MYSNAEKELRYIKDDVRLLTIYYIPEKFVEITCLDEYPSLTSLQIVGSFSSIPDKIFNNISIRELILVDLSIENYEELFNKVKKLKNLTDIHLIGLQINKLPSAIFDLPNLQHLHLKDCNIKQLSSQINNLTSLKSLNISNTKIKSIPPITIDSLRAITLCNNRIKELPKSILNISNIEYLELSNISITPNDISKLCKFENLKCLKLFHANISDFPDLSCLNSLSILMLNNNKIKSIPINSSILEHLTFLDLSCNPIANDKNFIEKMWQANKNITISAISKDELKELKKLK
jgi:Leucine-rich repeat (LRR) protein